MAQPWSHGLPPLLDWRGALFQHELEKAKGYPQMLSRRGKGWVLGKQASTTYTSVSFFLLSPPPALPWKEAPCTHVLLGGKNTNSFNWRALYSEEPFTLCSIRLMKHKLINSQSESIPIRFFPNSNESLPAKTLTSAYSINPLLVTCY